MTHSFVIRTGIASFAFSLFAAIAPSSTGAQTLARVDSSSTSLAESNFAMPAATGESWSRGATTAVRDNGSDYEAIEAPGLADASLSEPVNAGGQADRCDFISSFGTCVRDILHDQRGIWTSPAHIHRRDLLWLAPLAVATAVSIHYDAATLNTVDKSDSSVRFSNDYTHIGSPYVLVGGSAAIYALGKFTHNERVRETGVLEVEALADALFADEVLKVAVNRERPNSGTGQGRFWPDGSGDKEIFTLNGSFPSGHAIATWAFAHVLIDETPRHRWLHARIYILAAGVSVGRVTGRYHFPSDVVVGSALGYLIGGYVYRQHSEFYDTPATSVLITPISDSATRSYGLNVSFTPSLRGLPLLHRLAD